MKNVLLLAVAAIMMAGCGSSQNDAEKPREAAAEREETNNKEKGTKEKEISEQVEDSQPQTEQPQPSTETAVNQTATSPKFRMKNDFSLEGIEDPAEKIVLLTIDDAPDKHSLAMAETLKGLGANAIFFVNGHFIDTPEEAAILKKIHGMGFAIGNHTYSHKGLQDISEEEQRKEIVSLNDRIEEITGERPKFFRAPFGANTDFSKQVAAEEKMLVMNWTYGYDWEKEYQSKEALTDIMVNTPLLRNGANLLLHDRKWTSEALADIVKGLEAKGYKIIDPKLIDTP